MSNKIQAEIFICYDDSNNIKSYQDKPCKDNCANDNFTISKQEIIPLETKRHLPKKQAYKTKKKLLKKKEKQLKALTKQSKLKKREYKKLLNDHKITRIREDRKQKKCNLIKHKLTSTHKKLQEGYTHKQKLKINETLDYYQYLKKQYCK